MKSLLAIVLVASPAVAQTRVSDASIAAAGQFAVNPVIAASGSSYVIAWQEESQVVIGRADPATGGVATQLLPAYIPFTRALVPVDGGFLLFFTSNGNKVLRLDSRGTIAGSPRTILLGYGCVAASNGNRILAVNESGNGVILSSAGEVLVNGLMLSNAPPYTARFWAAAASRDRFLYVEWSYDGIHTTTLNTNGTILSTGFFAPNEVFGAGLAAASDGDRFVIMWRTPNALRGVDVAAGNVVTVTSLPMSNGALDLAWNGSHYVALLDVRSELTRLTIASDLSLLASEIVPAEAEPELSQSTPRLALNGAQTFEAWTSRSRCSDGYGQIAMSWNSGPPHVVTLGLADNADPVVAAGAGSPLVLWNEVRERSRLRGAPLPPDRVVNQAIATDGSGYLAAYVTLVPSCAAQMNIAAIDSGGQLIAQQALGPAIAPVSSIYPAVIFPPAVAWNGSEYLVAWMTSGSIVAVRVTAMGMVLDATPVVLAATTQGGYLTSRMVWANGQWIVFWWRSYLPYIPWHGGPPTENVISMRVVDRELKAAGDSVVVVQRGWSPAVATDGHSVFLSWLDSSGLNGALVDANGRLSAIANTPDAADYGRTISAACVAGKFYVLNVDRLYAWDTAAFHVMNGIPGVVSTSSMASDGQRLVLAWSAGHAVYSMLVWPLGARRRTVR